MKLFTRWVFVRLSIIYFSMNFVVCYENAYDLLERRNRNRFYESEIRSYPISEDFGRDHHAPRHYSAMRPYFSKFGNGYDNLGNGIPTGHFNPFRRGYQDGWRFEWQRIHPRPYNDQPGGYSFFVRPHQHNNYPAYSTYSTALYPKFEEKSTALNRNFGNEFGSRGNLDISKIDRYVEDNEDKKQKKTDEIFQRSQEGINMDTVKKENTGEKSHVDQTGENKSSLRSNKVVKKGYTTKGFASHHHKDETGNSTTFFDESSDFGGQSDYKDFADGFGTRKTLEQINHKEDEKFYKENGGQAGNYGTGLSIGNQKFEKDFSSAGHHADEDLKFVNGKENEEFGIKKNYRYLNGDRFDFSEPQPDHYY